MSYALYSFCAMFVCIIAIMLVTKSLSDPNVKSEKECEQTQVNKALDINKMKDGDPCDVWDGSSCRRGTVSGLLCVAQSSSLLKFLLGLFAVLFFATLYFYFFAKKDEPEAANLGFGPYRFGRI
jgi:hypothetical protein